MRCDHVRRGPTANESEEKAIESLEGGLQSLPDGVQWVQQDRVFLHLYDLSASQEKNADRKARREYEALHALQQHRWAPRILDSFQDAPGFAGEMWFLTVLDPAAPSSPLEKGT